MEEITEETESRQFGRLLPLETNFQLPEEGVDNEPYKSKLGASSSTSKDQVLSEEIIAEENRLAEKVMVDRRMAEEDAEQRIADEKMKLELNELRIKRYQHILKQSEFYSSYMKQKLTEKKRQPVAKKKPMRSSEQLDESLPDDDRAKTSDEEADVSEATYVNASGFTVSIRQPKLFSGGIMRDYQLDGLKWLQTLDINSVNGILGDEMGLGKTIQVIALLCHLVEQGLPGPYLIMGPLSTLLNWMMELKKFAPQLPSLMFHGNAASRATLCRKFQVMVTLPDTELQMHPIVVTSYQMPLGEPAFFRSLQWRYLIIDEGHKIKNHNTQLAMEVQQYNTCNRLLLTGTPLQNNLVELWALLHFLLPDIFADLTVFESWFHSVDMHKNQQDILQQEQECGTVSTLHKVLSPFLLRRTKADVNVNLPPKKEVLVKCPLSPLQKQLYQAVLDRTIHLFTCQKEEQDLSAPRKKRRCVLQREKAGTSYKDPEEEDKFEAENPHILEVKDSSLDQEYKLRICMQVPCMQLRHIVNHPYLLQMPVYPGTRDIRVDEELIRSSGKMEILDAMLLGLKKRGHKVLIFSEFVMVLNLIANMLDLRDHNYCRLDGQMLLTERQKQIGLFTSDPDVFAFIISTRAGGLGINLTAADTVIFYDSSYNPQVDLQAADRCHRIGQQRPVMVYRLNCNGTVDDTIISRANNKRRLEKIVMQSGTYKFHEKKSDQVLIDLQKLAALLKSTDHDREVHAKSYVFSDEELDQLLDRSDMLATAVEEESHH